jgi:hypothetical protein
MLMFLEIVKANWDKMVLVSPQSFFYILQYAVALAHHVKLWTKSVVPKKVVLESFTKPNRQPLLGLVKHSKTTDLWLGFLLFYDQDDKLKTTSKISNMFAVLVEYAAIRMEGVKITTSNYIIISHQEYFYFSQ